MYHIRVGERHLDDDRGRGVAVARLGALVSVVREIPVAIASGRAVEQRRCHQDHCTWWIEHIRVWVEDVSQNARHRLGRRIVVNAMAGKGLLKARSEVWQDILAWYKAAGARAVDAYAKPRLARVYQQKFGFDQGCSYVRMAL